MAVALRALRGRALVCRPTPLAFSPVASRPIARRFASSRAGPTALDTPFFRTGIMVAISLGAFELGLYPAVPFIDAYLKPPTDKETLELFKPQTEEQRAIDEFIRNHPVARDLRSRGFTESRPHMKFPEHTRQHHLTSGMLSGPGRIAVPPLVFEEKDGKSLVAISYLGNELCGHPGIIHGGLLATLLDEGLARCCLGVLPHKVGVTANLNVNYRAPAKADSYVVLRATTTKVEGRKAWVTGRIETLVDEGETPVVLAEATALFVSPKHAQYMRLLMPAD